jgi:hypothetical protein
MSDEPRIEQSQTLRTPWNKGKLTGTKPALKVGKIQAIRIRLQLADRLRDLALFNPRHRQQTARPRCRPRQRAAPSSSGTKPRSPCSSS